MLFLSTKLQNMTLMMVRNGGRAGTVLRPIINPNNLHIDAFYCTSVHAKTEQVLLDIHIRDFSARGIIIDDYRNLSDPDELIRLKPIMDIDFKLEGKTVFAGKQKIGKVAEYAINMESLFVQKLYVQPPVWKGLNASRLVFDRQSVLEVTDSHIVVSGPEVKVNEKASLRVRGGIPNYSANTSLISENE